MANIESKEWVMAQAGDKYTFSFFDEKRQRHHQVYGTIKEIAYVLFNQYMRNHNREYSLFWIDKVAEAEYPEIWLGFDTIKDMPEDLRS
jgi:hypothetical protein